ncbi:hypothetical protein [Methanobrevibacter sp.]|uniref:hypothetical protein n=1 Tax=Methanobrevibacter sp. TaxID=66852 RepID=UPI0026DF1A8B|nr:hypothetical protein [Methanobrevibacter sp.]MDO5859607.1 hypothetical protein [Methanobrevibacter sp.]
MSHYVNLEIRYSTYLNLCNAVEETATHAEDFNEIQELVHLVDFLEDEYERDRARQNLDFKTWQLHEELFQNKEIYHHQYFYPISEVLDDYEERKLLEMNISEQDKFHLICELIDVFKNDLE